MPDILSHPYRFYIWKHKALFALGVVALFITNLFDSFIPLFIGQALDRIVDSSALTDVAWTLGVIVALTLGLSLFRYLWRILWGRFHVAVADDLRNRLYSHYTLMGPSFYQRRSIGELMSLINNDVNSFRMAIGPGILILLDAVFLILIITPIMLSLSVPWTLKTLILMPLVPFVVKRVMDLIHIRYRKQQDQFAELSGSAQEIVSGVKTIKAYAQEDNQTRLFNSFNRRYELACNQVAKVDASFAPVLELSVTVGSVILLFVGAPAVIAGDVSVGQFFAFYQYIQRMVWPMSALGIGFNYIQEGNASFSRMAEALHTAPDVEDRGPLQIEQFQSLEVKDLSFTHPGKTEPTLKNISFRVEAGQSLGITGMTGSGKSTLIDLLTRVYAAPPKTIFINGHPIEELNLSQLRNMISVVPQDAFLFSSTVTENIALGMETHDPIVVEQAAQAVNMDREIKDFPQGYLSVLGEKGVNLSGGQRQRLTLARALLRKTPIVILDDSLSAVDAKTEKRILEMLREELPTSLIVSHRLASLLWADQILVLHQGSVEALGPREQVLKHSPTLQKIAALQSHREALSAEDSPHV